MQSPQTPARAILDFAAQASADAAGLAVEASNWRVLGLVVRSAAGSGILVSGSHNRIERCASWATRGTGLSIVASPDADPSDWPSYNQIINCESSTTIETTPRKTPTDLRHAVQAPAFFSAAASRTTTSATVGT